MTGFIKRDEAIRQILDWCVCLNKPTMLAREDTIDVLENMDGIDIVYCKDCRWLKETGGHANCWGYLSCRRTGKDVDWEDFCSWGKHV